MSTSSAARELNDVNDTISTKTNGTQKDIESDVSILQNDMAKLMSQFADILAAKGGNAWRNARSNIDGAVTDVQAKGAEAIGAVRDVSDNLVNSLDQSLKRNPYTTLALAIGLGVLFGATWRK
jgi:ElaB/YqjD/DUF883 family membrane-anchored ribosome-binding protein